MANFAAFKDWALMGLLAAGVVILWQTKENVYALNSTIAGIVKENELNKYFITDHEGRIRGLEKKK